MLKNILEEKEFIILLDTTVSFVFTLAMLLIS